MNNISKPKPPLGLSPRHFWLKNRIKESILALQRIEETDNWDLYLQQALYFSNEIKYAALEWEKYYKQSTVLNHKSNEED